MKIITLKEAESIALKLYPEPPNLHTLVSSMISEKPDAISDILLKREHAVYHESGTVFITTIAKMRKHYVDMVMDDWVSFKALHHAVHITKVMSRAPLGQYVYFGGES